MKSVIATNKIEIDFSTPQLLYCEGMVVMSTGEHSLDKFCGIVVKEGIYNLGLYNRKWEKSSFSFFNGIIELSND